MKNCKRAYLSDKSKEYLDDPDYIPSYQICRKTTIQVIERPKTYYLRQQKRISYCEEHLDILLKERESPKTTPRRRFTICTEQPHFLNEFIVEESTDPFTELGARTSQLNEQNRENNEIPTTQMEIDGNDENDKNIQFEMLRKRDPRLNICSNEFNRPGPARIVNQNSISASSAENSSRLVKENVTNATNNSSSSLNISISVDLMGEDFLERIKKLHPPNQQSLNVIKKSCCEDNGELLSLEQKSLEPKEKLKQNVVSVSDSAEKPNQSETNMEHYKKRLIQTHEHPNAVIMPDFIPLAHDAVNANNVQHAGSQSDINVSPKSKPAKTDHNTQEKGEKISKIAKKRAVSRKQFRHQNLVMYKLGKGQTGSLCQTKEFYNSFAEKCPKINQQNDARCIENLPKEGLLERTSVAVSRTNSYHKNLPKKQVSNDLDTNKNVVPGRHVLPAIIPAAPKRKNSRNTSRSEYSSEDDKLSEGRNTPPERTPSVCSAENSSEKDVAINLTLRRESLPKDSQTPMRKNGASFANPASNIMPLIDAGLERVSHKKTEQNLNSRCSENLLDIGLAHSKPVETCMHRVSNQHNPTVPPASQTCNSNHLAQMADKVPERNSVRNHTPAKSTSQTLDPNYAHQAAEKPSKRKSDKIYSPVTTSAQVHNSNHNPQVSGKTSDKNSHKNYLNKMSRSSQILTSNDLAQAAEQHTNINYSMSSLGNSSSSVQRNFVANHSMDHQENVHFNEIVTPPVNVNSTANYSASHNDPNLILQAPRVRPNLNRPMNFSDVLNASYAPHVSRNPNMMLPVSSQNSIQTTSNINHPAVSQNNTNKDLILQTPHLNRTANYLGVDQNFLFCSHGQVNPMYPVSSPRNDNQNILAYPPGINTNINRPIPTETSARNFIPSPRELLSRPIASPKCGGRSLNTGMNYDFNYPVSYQKSNIIGFHKNSEEVNKNVGHNVSSHPISPNFPRNESHFQESGYGSSTSLSPVFTNQSNGGDGSFPMIHNQMLRHTAAQDGSGGLENRSETEQIDTTVQRPDPDINYINQVIETCKSNMEVEFGLPILITLNIWYKELNSYLTLPQEIKFKIDSCKQDIIFFVSSKLFGTNYTLKLKKYIEQMMDICLDQKKEFLIKNIPLFKNHCHDELWLIEFITSLKQKDAPYNSNKSPDIQPPSQNYNNSELKRQLIKSRKGQTSEKKSNKKNKFSSPRQDHGTNIPVESFNLNRTRDNFTMSKILNNHSHNINAVNVMQTTSEVRRDTQSLPQEVHHLTNNSRLVHGPDTLGISYSNSLLETQPEPKQNAKTTPEAAPRNSTDETVQIPVPMAHPPEYRSQMPTQDTNEPERDTGQVLPEPLGRPTNFNIDNSPQDMEDLLHTNFIVNKNKTSLAPKKNINIDTDNSKKQHNEGNVEYSPLSDSSNDTSISVVAVDKSMEITRSRSTQILEEVLNKKGGNTNKTVENDVIVQKIKIDQPFDLKKVVESKEDKKFWDLYCTDKYYAGEFKEFKETLKATNPEVYNQIVGQMRRKLEAANDVIMIEDDEDLSKLASDLSTTPPEPVKKKQKTTDSNDHVTFDSDIVEIRDIPTPAQDKKQSPQCGIEDISDDETPVKSKQQRPIPVSMSIQNTGTKNLFVRSQSVESSSKKTVERVVNPELIYGSALLSNNTVGSMPNNLLVRNNVYNSNIQISPVPTSINNSNVNWSSWMSVEDRQRFFSLSPIIRRQSIETPPGEELIEVTYEREKFLICKKRLELIPKGKLFYFAEMNMLIKYKDDKEIKNILDQLQVSGPLVLSSKLIAKTDVLIIPESIRFSPTDKLSEPTYYVDEISNVEKHIPKSFYQFYKFVTGYQIVNNNAPVSFQTFLMMHNTDRLKGLFKKYLCSLEEGRG